MWCFPSPSPFPIHTYRQRKLVQLTKEQCGSIPPWPHHLSLPHLSAFPCAARWLQAECVNRDEDQLLSREHIPLERPSRLTFQLFHSFTIVSCFLCPRWDTCLCNIPQSCGRIIAIVFSHPFSIWWCWRSHILIWVFHAGGTCGSPQAMRSTLGVHSTGSSFLFDPSPIHWQWCQKWWSVQLLTGWFPASSLHLYLHSKSAQIHLNLFSG